MSVEGLTNSQLCKALDCHSGIDAFQVRQDSGMRGIGSRIQWIDPGKPAYNTFTIRKCRDNGAVTEFEKRHKAIKNKDGWLYPHWTVHAYVQEPKRQGPLLSLGVARTFDLVEYIIKYPRHAKVRKVTKNGAATFYAVQWNHFRAMGYPMKGFLGY